MDPKYIVALELSGTQVKGALASIDELSLGNHTLPTIDAIVSEDNCDCVQFGRVQNLLNATTFTSRVINKLQSEPVLGGGRIDGVFVGFGGRSLGSEYVTSEINLPTEMEITEEILHSLYEEASKRASQNKKVLKVLPRKFYVDNRPDPDPVGSLGHRLKGEFTLVTCNPINRRNLDLVFSDRERVNMPVRQYIVTPLALADMLLDEEEKQLGCVLIDLGAQTTTISIYKDRALQHLATLPMGSKHITTDISTGMNLTMEKAENVKCTYGDATPQPTQHPDDVSRMNAFVAARAYEIVANITACLNYAKFKTSDLPEGFILTGRGSRLKNFDALLASETKMRVRHASVPSNINFALSANDIQPDDYMSLLAIVMYVNRNPKFESCVYFPKKETVVVPVPEAETKVEKTEPVQQKQPTKVTQKPSKPDVEKNWDKDDPEEEPTKKPDRSGGSFLSSIKQRVINLVSSSDMDDDADIDE